VVDAANVMGARPDGWWRDRAGAAARLHRRIAVLAEHGIDTEELPAELAELARGGWDRLNVFSENERVHPVFVVVLEGRGREAAGRLDAPNPHVRVVIAPGSGDDTIVSEVDSAVSSGTPCLAVTADRELRQRCVAAGGRVAGPRWLLHLL
jgi:hypothetical protein